MRSSRGRYRFLLLGRRGRGVRLWCLILLLRRPFGRIRRGRRDRSRRSRYPGLECQYARLHLEGVAG
jgi:hypothetical protein